MTAVLDPPAGTLLERHAETSPPAPTSSIHFTLPAALEATTPAEVAGHGRDDVRLMVSEGTAPPRHLRFADLPSVLRAGDLLVVNTSATVPAAIPAQAEGPGATPGGEPFDLHLSTLLPDQTWLVEPRRPRLIGSARWDGDVAPDLVLPAGGRATVLGRWPGSQRLWRARLDLPAPLPRYLAAVGHPIRYAYVAEPWPIEAYQTVFGREPASAEMASAARAFTPELVTELVVRGVGVAPITLHTGVSSLEAHEAPYPERFRVSAETAERVDDTHRHGHRVIAVGTTSVRALESAAGPDGSVHAADGWTDLVISAERGVRVVDGLLTGWHEPEATHLAMLEAVAGPEPLRLAYPAALAEGYRWHEFGDLHLLLPGPAGAAAPPARRGATSTVGACPTLP
jgi:S-adenosylmethionine:tRNA ribosyltransferase-isomerase